MKSQTRRIELDWSRLLGFDQVKRTHALPTRVGAEVGSKPEGTMAAARLGAKVGAKPGIKATARR